MKKLLVAWIVFGFGLAVHAAEKQYVIGMSQCNLGEPWRVQMNTDIKNAAEKHPNIKMIFKDAQNDSLKQRAQIEEFVSSKVDLIIVSPKEAAPLTPPVADAYKKGVPVIVLDRRVLGSDYTSFIGADNKKIGRAAGKWVVSKLGGKGANLKVVFDADMKWLEPNARKEMESALATHPKIDLVYGHNDPGAHGAYLAAKAAGREKQMLFIGIDALPHEGQAYVRQGILAASFEYPTGGREAIDMALDIFAGKQVAKEVTLESHVFTKDNVDSGGEWLK